jgi:hypothetical protein
MYLNEDDYKEVYTSYSSLDFIYNTIFTFIYFLEPQELKDEITKSIEFLSLENAIHIVDSTLIWGGHTASDYYHKNKDEIESLGFSSIRKKVQDRFKNEIIDNKENMFDYFNSPSFIWFSIQRGNISLDLEQYILPLIITSKERLFEFINFYTISYNRFTQETLDTFRYSELLEEIKNCIGKFNCMLLAQ